MKVSIEEFSEKMCQRVGNSLGEDYEVSVEHVLKNNSCRYYGIIIKNRESDNGFEVTPAIYVHSWYERYLNGENVEDMEVELLETYRVGIDIGNSISVADVNRKGAEKNLYYRLVNKVRNEELLKNSPYIEFLDFAITFYYLCNENCEGIQSFRVTDKLMNEWGFDVNELFSMADDNMYRLFPDKIQNISEVIAGFAEEEEEDYWNERTVVPIYVLTNEQGINGAATLIYSNKIKELSESLDSDLYVLPSSIHEVLLVPEGEDITAGRLRSMVNEVNTTQVIPEEQLSDNLYFYSRETGKIGICV